MVTASLRPLRLQVHGARLALVSRAGGGAHREGLLRDLGFRGLEGLLGIWGLGFRVLEGFVGVWGLGFRDLEGFLGVWGFRVSGFRGLLRDLG